MSDVKTDVPPNIHMAPNSTVKMEQITQLHFPSEITVKHTVSVTAAYKFLFVTMIICLAVLLGAATFISCAQMVSGWLQ
jgi:hypothetical protein